MGRLWLKKTENQDETKMKEVFSFVGERYKRSIMRNDFTSINFYCFLPGCVTIPNYTMTRLKTTRKEVKGRGKIRKDVSGRDKGGEWLLFEQV